MTSHPAPVRPDVTETQLIGGVEKRTIEIVDYDERWPDWYLAHEQRIRDALAGAGIQIEHIGSTSVPGLAAKPILDVLVVVEHITAEEDHAEPLVRAGYELRVREPGHRLVRTPERDVHVHLLERGDPGIEAYLLLRDRLRTDAADRALYAETKRELASRDWEEMNDYADAKTDVIAAILSRARQRRGVAE
ncbi:GrpB family protein [Brachybacterium sp.]|uniref:GrpB family protein n=1 Tax=unclassified Brachybacterium TaxID=2623841 RepID=UPI003F8F0E5C